MDFHAAKSGEPQIGPRYAADISQSDQWLDPSAAPGFERTSAIRIGGPREKDGSPRLWRYHWTGFVSGAIFDVR